jgi:peptidoglycan/LPS O-acetylase OafA/YrhL
MSAGRMPVVRQMANEFCETLASDSLGESSAQTDLARAEPGGLRGRMPGLDGLRGLAILMVMALHFGGGIARGATGVDLWFSRVSGAGWVGVDLFFVLSGFLITGILYDTKGTPGCLRNFYARRVLRIFPLYYGALLVLFVVLPLIGRGSMPGVAKVAEHQGWLWFYCSNFASVFIGDKVFAGGLVQAGHYWSLAVEEQFYLVWPLVVLWLRRETLMKVCGVVIAAVVALRVGLVVRGFEWVYFFTPCRLDGLMAGAMVSLILRGRRKVETLTPACTWIFLTCGAALAAIWWERGLDSLDWTMGTAGFTLLAGLFSAGIVLVLAAPASSWRRRVFGGRVLGFFGKYSYGLYVFHWALEPTFRRYFSVNVLIDRVFHHYWPARIAYMGMAMAISVLAAWVSWNIYEKQFLKLKRFFECRPAAASGHVEEPMQVGVLKAA